MTAKAKTGKTYYEEFLAEFNSKNPKSIYLITGQEEFLKLKIQNLLLSNLVDPSTRDFNYECVSANEVTAGEIIALCNSIPFGPGRRVVRVTNCSRTSPTFRKQLAGYIPQIPADTSLLMHFGHIRSSSKFFQEAAKKGVFLDCTPPFPWRFPEFVKMFLAEHGFKSSNDVVRAILETVGTDLYSIYNEIYKLRIYLGDEKSITEEIIREFCGASNAMLFDEFTDALGKKNLAKAIKLANGALLRTDSVLKVIFMTISMFNAIYEGLQIPKGSSIETFLRRRVPYPKIRNYAEYISIFKKEEVEKIFSLLFFAEWEAKLNPTPGQQLLQIISYYVCRPSKYKGINPFPGIAKLN
ncbi:MAG: DNA polymerase III subunit delta [candidate division Zixibacteria bacterium]|nr:DNA polymerase III subunit delta [candidate division Zixibacteria bacterium]